MLLGADTDEMRGVQKECLEVARTADQVIAFLVALVVVLKAMSFWTGGSSAAYAAYLESTVIPWLKKVSAALKLFARVLGANAQAQDDISAGETVDLSALPRYQPAQLPATSCTDAPCITVPGSTPAATGATAPASSPAGVDGSSATTPGAPQAPGAVPGAGSTYTGGTGGGIPAAGGAGALGATGGGSGGSGGALPTGSATDALGTGSTEPATGTASGTTGGADTSTYDAGQASTGDALGGGATPTSTPLSPASDGSGGTGGTGAGTYAAAGTAGALGVGSAAALAGRGSGSGTGFTSPDGFDYTRVQGVANNANVTPEFLRRTEQIATKLGCKPQDLLAVMSFETGGSFSPAQPNSAGGSARGLIQFMPDTARGLGTTSAELVRMSPVRQLDYVEKYFGTGRYTTVEGLYSKVLAGRAVNDPTATLFEQGSARTGRAYTANRGVDINRDGLVTAGEAAAKVRARIRPGD